MDREITIRDYLNVAWSGRWLILVTTVLGIIVGILVSVAHITAYTASARVFLGQPTSIQGTVVPTPLTSAQTAVGALDITGLSDGVAHTLRIPQSVVRGHVHVVAITGVGVTTSAPPVLEVTASNARPAMAVTLANQFANEIVTETGAPYTTTENLLAQQVAQDEAQVQQLTAQVNALRGSGSSPGGAVALAADTQLLSAAQTNAASAQLGLAKTRETETPRVLAQAYGASSSNTAPKRLQSVALAGLVGLLIGLIATFIWRGSPAARASDA